MFRTTLIAAAAAAAITAFLPATAAAETIDFRYDRNGRLISVVYDSGVSITYEHDASGNIVRRTVATVKRPGGPSHAKAPPAPRAVIRRVI